MRSYYFRERARPTLRRRHHPHSRSAPLRPSQAGDHGGGPSSKSSVPDEITTWEILVRLPPTALLRCRAVCRSWRRATSSRDFLLAHHARQPSLPLLDGTDRGCLFTFDHRAAGAQLQPVARLDQSLYLAGSCGGLLVFYNLGLTPSYSICNPATRQYAQLPMISGFYTLGMYQHRPTGEYRMLMYLKNENPADDGLEGYVFTLGSVQPPRNIGWLPVAQQDRFAEAAVLVRGCLHWYLQPYENTSNIIMVFDTTAESFREMHAPFTPVSSCRVGLFEMDGMLAMSNFKHARSIIDIWVLHDYESEVWTANYSIKLPITDMDGKFWIVRVVHVDDECLVLVNFNDWILQVDMDGKLVDTFHHKDILDSTEFKLKQSLVPHTFFPALEGYVVNAPPFI